MAQTYRGVIVCELFHQEVFAGRQSPMVFGDHSLLNTRNISFEAI